MNDTLREFVKKRLDALDLNPFEAARRGGLERGYLNDILIGRKNSIRDDKKAQVAAALGVSIDDLIASRDLRRKVPVLGFASAGGDEIRFAEAQGPFGEIDPPTWATEKTVAIAIRGTSLGVLLDGWYALYDDRRDPPDESLYGHICICGLANGSVVIKKLRPGSSKGRYHLESATEGTRFDEIVTWAAKVRGMEPPDSPQRQKPVSRIGKRRLDR